MEPENDNSSKLDYLAPGVDELTRQRGGSANDPLNRGGTTLENVMTRAFARRLLPACLAAPAVIWWVLWFGQHRGWYDLRTCFTLFVFSVTLAFGVIVIVNLKRLSKMEAERAQTAEQLKIAKEAAEAANRFKSAFFANISHEIRTPLTAINGFAELLLNPKRSADERTADARIIRRNGQHLLTLINDILDLSKIEAGKMSVERILCCPAQLVGDVCSMLRHRAAEKKLKLDVKFDGQIPRNIQTDPTRMRQILINLISNAIKFTKHGGITVTVSIAPSLRAPNPQLQVKIQDTGIGISEEQQAALFQPFVQADATITRQYGGSGLGLAISRHFARALGGDITMTSKPGKGSVFTIAVETGSLVDVDIHEHPEKAMESHDNFAGPNVRINGSILVAEDGIDNQALIATRLRQAGLSVEIAPNGKIAAEKALEALRNEKPFDLILMDVQMPVMDGFSATLHLRGKGYRGPVIALTANAMERDRDKCLQAGCNDFVTKPIQLDKLFKAIGRYLAVEQIKEEPAGVDEASAAISRAAQVSKFYEELPEEIQEIEEAIERQDRVRLKELIQLILGKAAAAGLKELAPDIARLWQASQGDAPWSELRTGVKEFASAAQPKSAAA